MKLEIGKKQYLNFGATTAIGANPKTWIRMLVRYRKDLDWQFIPKALTVLLLTCFNAPAIWWERKKYDKQIRATKVKQPLFIIGHQRSGTTYLHYLIGKDPNYAFCSVKESFMPWIFLSNERSLKKLLSGKMPDKRPMDNLKMSVDLPTEPEYSLGNMSVASMIPGYYFPRRIMDTFRKYVLFEDESGKQEWQANLKYFMQKLTIKHDSKALVMKSPENLGRIKEILEVFPDAKFLHIYRNPINVYFSTERLYSITIPMVAYQHCEPEVIQDFILESYPEYFEKYFKERELIPEGNLTEIRYEDLIGNEMAVLENAYSELNIDTFPEARPFIESEVRSYKDYKTNTYDFPEDRNQVVKEKWGWVFERLGY